MQRKYEQWQWVVVGMHAGIIIYLPNRIQFQNLWWMVNSTPYYYVNIYIHVIGIFGISNEFTHIQWRYAIFPFVRP